MMFDEFIESLAKRSGLTVNEGDYIKNGLVYCGCCDEPKQKVFKRPDGKEIIPHILCRCEREFEELGKAALEAMDKQARKKQLMQGVIQAEKFTECVFSNDDGRQPEITSMCKDYVNSFSELKKKGFGLMLYGERGKGKSFYAACIANALMDKGRRVLFGTLANLVMKQVDALHGKAEPINSKDYDLVVIDDLGIENTTQTAFSLVDGFYSNKVPMIVTTNLMPTDMKSTADIGKGRIYDRLLEVCPIKLLVANNGSRASRGKDNLAEMLEIMKKKG